MSILRERLRRTPDIVAASAAIPALQASKLERAMLRAQSPVAWGLPCHHSRHKAYRMMRLFRVDDVGDTNPKP
jgi:hypothetical protein